jgi:hypothetical protein
VGGEKNGQLKEDKKKKCEVEENGGSLQKK